MEYGRQYSVDQSSATEDAVFTIKIHSNIIEELLQIHEREKDREQRPSSEDYEDYKKEEEEFCGVEFTSESEGRLIIGEKEYIFRVINEKVKECYRLTPSSASSSSPLVESLSPDNVAREGCLHLCGVVQAKLLVQNRDVHKVKVSRAEAPKRSSQRISEVRFDTTNALPTPSSSSSILKSSKRKRSEVIEAGALLPVVSTKLPKVPRLKQFKWLAIRRVPGYLFKSDVKTLLESLSVSAMYLSSEEEEEEREGVDFFFFSVYVEFATSAGAALGLLRDGEDVQGSRTTGLRWRVESMDKEEAALAKGFGVRIESLSFSSKTPLQEVFSSSIELLPVEVRHMNPALLSLRWKEVVRGSSLHPNLVSDGSTGLDPTLTMHSPLSAYLLTPSYDTYERVLHRGVEQDDRITPEVAAAIEALVTLWATVNSSTEKKKILLDLCNRRLSILQLIYESCWRVYFQKLIT